MAESWTANTDLSLENAIKHMREVYAKTNYVRITWTTTKQRSETQNNALHKYCELLAEALNDRGLDMRTLLKPEIDIPWTKESVKNHLWRPIQVAMTDKESTAKANSDEYGPVYETLNRHLSDKFGVHVPWPAR